MSSKDGRKSASSLTEYATKRYSYVRVLIDGLTNRPTVTQTQRSQLAFVVFIYVCVCVFVFFF